MKKIWCYFFFITWVSLSKSIGFEYRSSFRKFDPSSVVLPCSCNFYFSYWFVWADCFGMHAFFWFVSCCMMLLSVLLFLCLHFSSEVGKGKRMSKWWMADAISLNSSSSPDGIWSMSVSDFFIRFHVFAVHFKQFAAAWNPGPHVHLLIIDVFCNLKSLALLIEKWSLNLCPLVFNLLENYLDLYYGYRLNYIKLNLWAWGGNIWLEIRGEGIGKFSIFVCAHFSNLLENWITSATWLRATNKHGKDNGYCFV